MPFGGIRGASPEADLDDAEDDADGVQGIGLTEGAITLDQVKSPFPFPVENDYLHYTRHDESHCKARGEGPEGGFDYSTSNPVYALSIGPARCPPLRLVHFSISSSLTGLSLSHMLATVTHSSRISTHPPQCPWIALASKCM